IRVKTPDTVSPRVPAPWQSAQGEAGPKARPQRRSRWQAGEDSGPGSRPLNPQGTVERSGGGFVDWPFKTVGGDPESRVRGAGATPNRVPWSRHARKACGGGREPSVP